MLYVIVACFIVLDFVTGLCKAFKEKNFTSSLMREGLFHKCASIIWVMFGVLVDYAQAYIDLGVTVPIAGMVCGYIILMECGSIMENLGKINPKFVPKKIKECFSKLNS